MKRRGTILAVLAAGSMLVGCRHDEPEANTPPAASTVATNGPVTIRVSLDQTELSTADQVRLTLDLTFAGGAGATMPDPPAELGGFTVVDSRVSAPQLDAAGQVRTIATWVLEPFLPGAYTVGPISVPFATADGSAGTVETEPMTVQVVSVLASADEAIPEIAPARAVISPPNERTSHDAAIWAAAAVGLAAAGLTVWAVRRRGRSGTDALGESQRRLLALQRELRDESGERADPAATARAIATAEGVVRRCLAATIEPRALARTSDELLLADSLTRGLSVADLGVVTASLRAADSVKFAGVPAAREDAVAIVNGALSLARTLAESGRAGDSASKTGERRARA